MRAQIKLGRIFGVEIGLHYSWFMIALLITLITEGLRGVRVADVMSRDYATVDGHSNLQTFVEEHLVRTGRRCFVVIFDGHAEGIITPNEVSNVERSRWPYTTVADVMRPLDQVRTVAPGAPVTEVLT